MAIWPRRPYLPLYHMFYFSPNILSEAVRPQIRFKYGSIWGHTLKYAYGIFMYFFNKMLMIYLVRIRYFFMLVPLKCGFEYGSIWGHIWCDFKNHHMMPQKQILGGPSSDKSPTIRSEQNIWTRDTIPRIWVW